MCSCTPVEAVNWQYPIFVRENRCHHLRGWLLFSKLGGRGEPLCFHYVDCSFVSGSYKYIKVSSIVTGRSKKPAVFRQKCSRIASEATTRLNVWCGTHLAEGFLMSNTWWILHVPESLVSFWLTILRSAKIMLWTASTFSGIDYLQCWNVLSSNPFYNCRVLMSVTCHHEFLQLSSPCGKGASSPLCALLS